MQFNSDADNQDLMSVVSDLTNTTTTDYSLASRTRAVNSCYREIWGWIFDSYGGWQFDDSNQTNVPEATATLTADQVLYTTPTNGDVIKAVEVKTTGGVWQRLQPLTIEQLRDVSAEAEFMKTSGQPRYYRLIGNVIKIYPAANYTQSASFRVLYNRDVVAFASTATTATPGFAKQFHEALAVGAALTWARRKDPSLIPYLEQRWLKYEQDIKKFYLRQFNDLFPPRLRVHDALKDAI